MLENRFIIAPVIAWLVAQILKFLIGVAKGNTNLSALWQAGGMPSGHSAIVSCLFFSVLFDQGANSILLGVVAVFGGIVLYDAMGVRRQASIHADLLNDLAKENHWNIPVLNENIGHTPMQVIGGIILGSLVSFIANMDQLTTQRIWLNSFATTSDAKKIYIFAIIILALGLIKLWIFRGERSIKISDRELSLKKMGYLELIFSVIFALIAYLGTQEIVVLGVHWFLVVAFISYIIAKVLVWRWIKNNPILKKIEDPATSRRLKWLKRAKKI